MANKGVTKIGPGRYRIRVYWTCRKTGRRKEADRYVEAATEDEASGMRAQLRAELAGGRSAPARVRLKDFAKEWSARNESGWRYSTALRNGEHVDKIVAGLGDIYLDALEPTDVELWLAEMAKKYSGHTCLGMLRVLRQVTRDAQWRLGLPIWPCVGVRPPKPLSSYTDEEPNLLTAPQLKAFLAALERSPAWHPLALTMAVTGARFAEVTALRWEDIDEEGARLRIRRSQYRGEVVEKPAKGGKPRTLSLPSELAEALRCHRHRMLRRQERGVGSGWVFPSPRAGGLHKSSRAFSKAFEKAAERAKIPTRITPHGLRRTFNNLVRQIASGDVARSITGHTTEAMTEHYSRVSVAEKAVAVGKVLQLVGIRSAS